MALSAGVISLSVLPDTKEFGANLKSGLLGKTAGVGEAMGGAILGGLKAMAGPIMAVTAAFGIEKLVEGSIKSFEALAGTTKGMQRIIGGTTEEVSGLAGAMKLSGVSADNVTGTLTIFSKKLAAAAGDAKTSASMTAALGTSFKDAHGNLLPMADLLPAVADRFKDMPNGIEKTALATQLFGRSGTQMIPFLNKGSEGIGELTAKAKEMGLVLDDTSMNSFNESKKASREFDATIQGLQVTIGSALLPVAEAFQQFVRDILAPAISGVTKFVREHREEFQKLADGIKTGLMPIVTALGNFMRDVLGPVLINMLGWIQQNKDLLAGLAVTVGGAIVAYMGFRAVTGIINAVKLAQEGYAAASYGAEAASYASQGAAKIGAMIYAIQNSTIVKSTAAWIANTVAQVANTEGGLLAKASVLIYSVATGIATAAQWAWNAAMTANPIGIIVVAAGALAAGIIWLATQTTFFQDTWKIMSDFVVSAWNNVVKFLGEAWNNIVGFFTGALKFIVDLFLNWTIYGFIIKHFGEIVGFFKTAWDSIIDFFTSAFTNINKAVSTGIGNVVKFFKDLPSNILTAVGNFGSFLFNAGRDVVQGLLNGIQSLGGTIGKFFLDLLPGWIRDPFKAALGIHSPSTVFHGYGENIGQGLINGLDSMQAPIGDAMASMSDGVSLSFENTVRNLGGKATSISDLVSKRNNDLASLKSAGMSQRDAMAGVNAANGGSLQAVLDASLGQATFTNSVTGMSTTMGGDLSNAGAQKTVADLLAQGYKQTSGATIIYNAAPNDSISSEQKLVDAVQRAKLMGAL